MSPYRCGRAAVAEPVDAPTRGPWESRHAQARSTGHGPRVRRRGCGGMHVTLQPVRRRKRRGGLLRVSAQAALAAQGDLEPVFPDPRRLQFLPAGPCHRHASGEGDADDSWVGAGATWRPLRIFAPVRVPLCACPDHSSSNWRLPSNVTGWCSAGPWVDAGETWRPLRTFGLGMVPGPAGLDETCSPLLRSTK